MIFLEAAALSSMDNRRPVMIAPRETLLTSTPSSLPRSANASATASIAASIAPTAAALRACNAAVQSCAHRCAAIRPWVAIVLLLDAALETLRSRLIRQWENE